MSQNLQQQLQTLAFYGKQTEMIYLIQKNITFNFNFNYALHEACYGGHKEIAEYLIKTNGANDFIGALYSGLNGGKKKIVEWIFNNYEFNNETLYGFNHDETLYEFVKNWLKRRNIITTSTQVIIVSD